MKPIYQVMIAVVAIMFIAALTFFAFGGNSQGQVSQENAPILSGIVRPTLTPTVEPTSAEQCVQEGKYLLCTYKEYRHLVNTGNVTAVSDIDRPILLEAEGAIDWESSQMTLSKENLGFWMGRSNTAWKEPSREMVYQKIFSYVREYRHGVKIESAKFDKLIVSRSPAIYLMKDVFVGGEYKNVGIRAYATTFTNPNNEEEDIKMVFFYDKEDDIVAFGYGDAKNIITKRNFVVGTDSGGSNSGSSSGGSSDSNGGSAGGEGPTDGPEGGVPS